jgi:2'-5' RNA ligase
MRPVGVQQATGACFVTLPNVTAPLDPDALGAHYDAMWTEAAPVVQAGGAAFDPQFAHLADDARRGVTLLARPAATVVGALSAFVEQLRVMEPDQYYQPPSDLHHTVLSLFTATADYAPYLAHLPAYREAVTEVAAATPPFSIRVRGVTLTPRAVLAQGFPLDGTLAAIRERLRAALGARGLGDALDRRYRLVTAHMTLIRFAEPLRGATRFVAALARERAREFGTTSVDRLELVFGDWYHTAAREQSIDGYLLDGSGAHLGSTAR